MDRMHGSPESINLKTPEPQLRDPKTEAHTITLDGYRLRTSGSLQVTLSTPQRCMLGSYQTIANTVKTHTTNLDNHGLNDM